MRLLVLNWQLAALCFAASESAFPQPRLPVEGTMNRTLSVGPADDPYELMGTARGTYLERLWRAVHRGAGSDQCGADQCQSVQAEAISPQELSSVRERKVKKARHSEGLDAHADDETPAVRWKGCRRMSVPLRSGNF
jgi:hypothetical protein